MLHEKVCVPCALNRNGLSIAKITNLGRVSTEDLNQLYADRIEEKSILCTDEMNSFIQFADKNNLGLKRLIFLQILCLQHRRKYCVRILGKEVLFLC